MSVQRFANVPVAALLVALLASIPHLRAQPAAGGMQMPDPKQMSGVPLPVSDLQPGTVMVRVIRGSLANIVTGQRVELLGDDQPLTSTTNEAGRAEFTGLKPGTRVKAVTTVDGERIESHEFEVPSAGGIRLMLVATDPNAEKKAGKAASAESGAPAARSLPGGVQSGSVVLGDQSRFVFEIGDEGLTVFAILQILNSAQTPVQPLQSLVFELPDNAQGAGILDGSSPQATVAGRRVTVAGPFTPGSTSVQFAYGLPYSGGDLRFSQTFPVALTQLTVIAQKVGDMRLSSEQLSQHRDMTAEGQAYIVGQGPTVKAGDALVLDFSGLPHHAVWPRNLAVAMAIAILGAGTWAAARTGRADAADASRRQKLDARRDRLFSKLASLEEEHQQGKIEETRYADRRSELVAALERVYTRMDHETRMYADGPG
jgi:hypothetical protein